MAGSSEQSALNIFQQAITNEQYANRVAALSQQLKSVTHVVQNLTELSDVEIPFNSVAGMLLTYVNGTAVLPEQNVTVEYLKADQRLKIPVAVGMSVIPNSVGRCGRNQTLYERYHKIATLSFTQIRSFVDDNLTAAQVRTFIDDLQMPLENQQTRKTSWFSTTWYTAGSNQECTPAQGAAIMGIVSHRLQFNCDLRDSGYLNTSDAVVDDKSWRSVSTTPRERIENKLQPFTLQAIAAMNLVSVASNAIAAWARAYGVGAGILPDMNSRCVSELAFTTVIPSNDDKTKIIDYEQNCSVPLASVSLNIIAMFGLFHLNKDHTYRTGDSNMERIGASYVNTLRTGTNSAMIESMLAAKEAIVRTCAHPFGLSQTYWLAQVMHRYSLLMSPLMVRFDVTPPPVQRLMIVHAAAKEWDGLPAGRTLTAMFRDDFELIRSEVIRVKAQPPSYSGLYSLYGDAAQLKLDEPVEEAIAALMPAVYGYVMVTHVNERNERDGLALALSLKNVERDAKGLVGSWRNAWEKYINDIDTHGLHEFIRQLAETMGRPAPGAGPFAGASA